MFGTAIETIVWSMNVIATAKIIAASTQLRPCMRSLTVPLPAEPHAEANAQRGGATALLGAARRPIVR